MSGQSDDQLVMAEKVLACGIIQEPRRLNDLRNYNISDFTLPEVRLVVKASRDYNHQHARQGKVRYAGRDALDRLFVRYTRSTGKSKERDKHAQALLDSVRIMVDEVSSWPITSDHDFADAIDQLQRSAIDKRTRVGLLRVVQKLQAGQLGDLHAELSMIARDVDPKMSDLVMGELRTGADNVLARYNKAKITPGSGSIATPFPYLTDITSGGGRAGRMWIVAAYTGDGKTQTAKELCYHAATECGRHVVIVTSEQTKDDMETMMTVRHSHRFTPDGLDFNKVERGQLDARGEAALKATVDDLRTNSNYGTIRYVQTPANTTMSDVRSILDTMRHKAPVDAVMLDHTMLFLPTRRGDSEVGSLSNVLRESKQIALDHAHGQGLWMIACHQIKSDGWERAQTRGYYVLTDLAGTSEAARSADVVMWGLRTDELKDMREMRIGVAKDRWGSGDTRGFHVIERFNASALFPIAAP